MDAETFGLFLQARRKELGMTQADLAQKLHVTSKAVSRWERGVGFPDIQLLQPLADALEITLVELMQSKRIREDLPKETADALVSETMNTIKQQGKLTRKRKLILYAGNSVILAAEVFLLWVLNSYDFPAWVEFCLRMSAMWGGSWCIRALRCIVTGEYIRESYRNLEWTWKTWLAFGTSVAGFVLLLYVMRWGYDGWLRRDIGGILGVFLMLAGGIGCIELTRETCDE